METTFQDESDKNAARLLTEEEKREMEAITRKLHAEISELLKHRKPSKIRTRRAPDSP